MLPPVVLAQHAVLVGKQLVLVPFAGGVDAQHEEEAGNDSSDDEREHPVLCEE